MVRNGRLVALGVMSPPGVAEASTGPPSRPSSQSDSLSNSRSSSHAGLPVSFAALTSVQAAPDGWQVYLSLTEYYEWFFHPATGQWHYHPGGSRSYQVQGYPGYALTTTGFHEASYYADLPMLQLPGAAPAQLPAAQGSSSSSAWLGPAPDAGEPAVAQGASSSAQSSCGAGASGAPASAAPGVSQDSPPALPAASLDTRSPLPQIPLGTGDSAADGDPQGEGAELCYLCYSEIRTDRVSPGCEHQYHADCWRRYLRSANPIACPVTTCPRYEVPIGRSAASACKRCGRIRSPTWEQEALGWADCSLHCYHYECLRANIEEDGQECPICGPRPATPPPPLTPPPRSGTGEENPWADMSDEVLVRTHPPGWHPVRHSGNCGNGCPCCRSLNNEWSYTCPVCDARLGRRGSRSWGGSRSSGPPPRGGGASGGGGSGPAAGGSSASGGGASTQFGSAAGSNGASP